MSQPVQQQSTVSLHSGTGLQVDEMRLEFARMAERSNSLLRELTAVRRRMDELAACIGDANPLPARPELSVMPKRGGNDSTPKGKAGKPSSPMRRAS